MHTNPFKRIYKRRRPYNYSFKAKDGEKADQWIERKTRESKNRSFFVDIIVGLVMTNDNVYYGAILRDCHMFIKRIQKHRKQVVSK